MQPFKIENIIDRVCEKKGMDKDLMRSISNHIFSKTKEEMYKFEDLSIYLRGFIAFYYGKSRLIKLKKKVEDKLKGEEVKLSFIKDKTDVELQELLEKINKLLVRYEEYITEKKTIKTAYKNAKLAKIQALEASRASSSDNVEKHTESPKILF